MVMYYNADSAVREMSVRYGVRRPSEAGYVC